MTKVLSLVLVCNDVVKGSSRQESFNQFKLLFGRIKKEHATITGYHTDKELAELFEKIFFCNLEGMSELARTSRVEAIEAAADICWPGIDELLKIKLPSEITREGSSLLRKRLEQLLQS